MSLSKTKRNRAGFILITLYMLLPILLLLTGSIVAYAISEATAVQRVQASTQALYLAEAGLDDAIVSLRGDDSWLGGSGVTGNGTFSVAIESLSSTRLRLTSVGNSDFVGDPITRMVEAIVDITPNALFQFSLFGDQSVTLNGNAKTDSYNSATAAYNVVTAGAEGDVGTNGTASGAIEVNGNARINGDAVVGEGADPTTAIVENGNAIITGSSSAADEPFVLPDIEIPNGLNSSGALTVSGNTTRTYAGGTYRFTSISISGNGKLNFTGPATVYVTGNVSIAGNGVGTASSKPPNLIVYVDGSHTVSVSGNGNFYGAIYAPDSPITINGNGAFYGAAIGHTVTNNGNGSGFHYDLAIRAAVGGSGSTVEVKSWQDVS